MTTQRKTLDKAKAKAALEEVWKDAVCPFSGHKEWAIADDFVEMRPYYGGDFVVGEGNIYPAVMVVCAGCGHMALFSAVRLGLLGKEESDE
jgi:hypothetical protein